MIGLILTAGFPLLLLLLLLGLEADKAPKRDDTLSAAVVEPNSPAQGNVRRRKGEGSKTGSMGYKSETQTWESNKEYERTT